MAGILDRHTNVPQWSTSAPAPGMAMPPPASHSAAPPVAANNVYAPRDTPWNPLLAVKSNDQLDAEKAQAEAAAQPEPTIMVSSIAGYIRTRFQEALLHKTQFITNRLLECQRRIAGEYEPSKLAQIKSTGGCESYFNFTETKKSSLAAWILDTIGQNQEKPWALEPTPIPDIPERTFPAVIANVINEFKLTGAPVTPDNVADITLKIRDEMLKKLTEEAKEKVARMELKIEDQLEEAGFAEVIAEFIDDLATYPTAFVKGPEQRKVRKLAWDVDGTLSIGEEILQTYTAPSPHDMYPAPNARHIQEGDLCEIVTYDVQSLMDMRGTPGWSTEAINEVLREMGSASNDLTDAFLFGQAERAYMENRDPSVHGGVTSTTTKGLEFWGAVSNQVLESWGMADVGPEFEYTKVNALMIGRHVVYCVKNPHPLGYRPYSATSFKKVKGSLWGKALPEVMADCQDGACAALRNLIDNLAFAAGPMLMADIDVIPAEFDVSTLYARMVLQYNGSKLPATGSRMPYELYQPSANADTLLQTCEYFDAKADDRTQIPRYVHGNEDVGGAGQTASGMSMLMGAATKGVKLILGNLDRDVIRSVIQRQYTYNMLNDPDPGIKGDAKVMPRGVMALLVREQMQLRRQEFADRTNNPTDLQIIGLEGRAALLRKIAEGLDMPVDDIVPTEQAFAQKLAAMQAQQQAQAQAEAMAAPAQKVAA